MTEFFFFSRSAVHLYSTYTPHTYAMSVYPMGMVTKKKTFLCMKFGDLKN